MVLQTNPEIISQLKFLPKRITRAISKRIPFGHNVDERRSVQPMLAEKLMLKKTKPKD